MFKTCLGQSKVRRNVQTLINRCCQVRYMLVAVKEFPCQLYATENVCIRNTISYDIIQILDVRSKTEK